MAYTDLLNYVALRPFKYLGRPIMVGQPLPGKPEPHNIRHLLRAGMVEKALPESAGPALAASALAKARYAKKERLNGGEG